MKTRIIISATSLCLFSYSFAFHVPHKRMELPEKEIRVLAITRSLYEGRLLLKTDLGIRTLPKKELPRKYFLVEQYKQIIGRKLSKPMERKDILTEDCLVPINSPNQNFEPSVTTPVDEVEAQSSQTHILRYAEKNLIL